MFIAYFVALFVGIMPAGTQAAARGKANGTDRLTAVAAAHSVMGTMVAMAGEYASPPARAGNDRAATATAARELLANNADLHPALVSAAQRAVRRAPGSWADDTDAEVGTGSMSMPQASPAPANGADDDDGFTLVGKKGKPVRKAHQHTAAPRPQQHHARTAQQHHRNAKSQHPGTPHSASPRNGAGAATPCTQPSPKMAASNNNIMSALHNRKPSGHAQNVSERIMHKANGTPAAAGAGAASLPAHRHENHHDLATQLALFRAEYNEDMTKIVQRINDLTDIVGKLQEQLNKIEQAQADIDFPPLGSAKKKR